MPDDSNPKTIEQAVQQLRYAVVSKATDALMHQIDNLLGTPNPIFIIVPIIVTTAELWFLKRGVTVEDVRQAKDIQDVAQSTDLIVHIHEPDKHDRKFTIDMFANNFEGAHINKLHEALTKYYSTNYDAFVNRFAYNTPSLFVIIQYQRFEQSITKLYKYFSQSGIIVER